MTFECSKCGACCQLFNPFTGIGRCPKLIGDDLCSIYESRPTICRVDEMAEVRGIPAEEYYEITEQSCLLLQKAIGVSP